MAFGDRLEYSLQADSKQGISSTAGEQEEVGNNTELEMEKDGASGEPIGEGNITSAELNSNNLSPRKLDPDEV